MTSRNELKRSVLEYVGEMGPQSSKEVSEWLGRASGQRDKTIPVTLLNCFRQRLLTRTLSKRGRVREYLYVLSDRGRKRLAYYSAGQKEIRCGVVDTPKLVEEAKRQTRPFTMNAYSTFVSVANICDSTRETGTFSIGESAATASLYLPLQRDSLVSAFAAKDLLRLILPAASETIADEVRKLSIEDMIDTWMLSSGIDRLWNLSGARAQTASITNRLFLRCASRRIDELHFGQFQLNDMLEEEKGQKELYKAREERTRRLYEAERNKCIVLERTLDHLTDLSWTSTAVTRAVAANAQGAFCDFTRSLVQADLKIIENPNKNLTEARDSLLIRSRYYIRGRRENTRLEQEIEILEDVIDVFMEHWLWNLVKPLWYQYIAPPTGQRSPISVPEIAVTT